MSTPGAVTSGFICSEIGVGPLDEKPAITSAGPASPSVDAATVIAFARAAGRADRALARVAEVVAGGDHRDDARVGGAVDRLHDDVPRRLDLGLAEREVDHVHAVLDRLLDPLRDLRRVAVEPEVGRRHGEHLVVAEVRARRDPGDAHAAARDRRERVVVAGGDARDVRRVVGVLRVERRVRVLPCRFERRERVRDDHLRRRERGVPLREAGGVREAGGREEDVASGRGRRR